MSLDQELQTYNLNKAQLLSRANGQFVLVRGSEIVATYANYNDALTEGYRRFGNSDFLVKEIKQFDNINHFSRPLTVV